MFLGLSNIKQKVLRTPQGTLEGHTTRKMGSCPLRSSQSGEWDSVQKLSGKKRQFIKANSSSPRATVNGIILVFGINPVELKDKTVRLRILSGS